MTSTLPALVQATSGAIGSACANTIAYPLDVTTTRLQIRKHAPLKSSSGSKQRSGQGLIDAYDLVRNTARRKGFAALYAGLGSDTASTLLSNFLYFYAYTFLRDSVQRRVAAKQPAQSKKQSSIALTVPQELGIGFLAGVLSRLVTTPLSVVTVRLQLENDKDDDADTESDGSSSGLLGTMREIYSDDGISGFWKGFQSTIVLSSNPAITLLLFQLFRRLLLRGKSRETPSPLQAFVLAGLSNSIAVSILYPIILIKTRLQSARKSKDVPSNTKDLERAIDTPLSIAQVIIRRDGPKGLYQGLEAQILKGILSQGVTFSMKQRIENAFIALYRLSLASRTA